MRLSLLILTCLFCGMTSAAEIRSLDVNRSGDRVLVDSQIVIAAPRAAVFAALSDYDRFDELSDRFLQSNFIESDFDGTPRVYTKVSGCVLFFCRTVERVARLELTPDTLIIAVANTQLSDLRFGHERWALSDTEGGTLIVYRYELEPDFWVPPVIGVWAIKRIAKKDALSAAAKIELMALEQ